MSTQPMIDFENFPAEQFTGTPVSVSEDSIIIEFRGEQIKATKTEEGWVLAELYENRWLTKYYGTLGFQITHGREPVIFKTSSEALQTGIASKVKYDAYTSFRNLTIENMRKRTPIAKDYAYLTVNFESHLAIYRPGEKPC